MSLTIAQLTDIHISPDLKPSHDVDVVANFKAAIEDIKSDKSIDLLVVTGDLCLSDGNITTTEWVKEQLDSTGLDYRIIPGNHDNSVIIGQVFGMEQHLQSSELYYNEVVGDYHLIFLDTAIGSISVDQISWLKAMAGVIQQPTIVFMHHPPVEAVPFMDAKHAMEDRDEFQSVLSSLPHVKGVFCGHYHIEKTVHLGGMAPVFITPSTFFQISDQTEAFEVETHRIGWRKIVLNDGILDTRVKWMV